jgi:hypothetical protein
MTSVHAPVQQLIPVEESEQLKFRELRVLPAE